MPGNHPISLAKSLVQNTEVLIGKIPFLMYSLLYFNNKIMLYNIYFLPISYIVNRKFAVKASIDSLYIVGYPITETFSKLRLPTRCQVSTGP